MAGTSQQFPRAVPDTLFKVQFIQRGGKLYKILLPTLLKNSNTSNANISKVAISPIIFEARNATCVENIVRKSNEPSPFLKPVTLSQAAYKTIPLFGVGERIVDTDWLPEEAECIIQLVKNHKAFQEATFEENVALKISDNSGDFILHETEKDISSLNTQKNESLVNDNLSSEYLSSASQTIRALVEDVSKMMEEQTNCLSVVKTQNVSLLPPQLEKIPACELKAESLLSSNIKKFDVHSSRTNSPSLTESKSTLPCKGENCIGFDSNPYTNTEKLFLPEYSGSVKITNMQHNSSTNTLTSASSELDTNSKTYSALPNGRFLISCKEDTNYSIKKETINDTASVEDSKSFINLGNKTTEMTANGSISSLSSEESLLLQEKLKNAKTIKIHPHGNSLASKETAKSTLQTSLGKINIKDLNCDRNKSKELTSTAAPESMRVAETAPIFPVPKSQMQIESESSKKLLSDTDFGVSSAGQGASSNVPAAKKLMLHIQRAKSVLNTCGVLVEIALRDHDYALKEPYPKKAGKHSTLLSEKCDRKVSAKEKTGSNYILRSVLRPKDSSTASPKGHDKKPEMPFLSSTPVTFEVASTTSKQNYTIMGNSNSVTGTASSVKGFIKLVMPKVFSKTCTSADSTQAINRIAKLNAITGGTYQVPTTKYNKTCISDRNITTASIDSTESTMDSVNQVIKDSEQSSQSDSSITEDFIMMEPEVLISEMKGTFIFQDGKLKFCPPRKRASKKRNLKKLPNKSGEKHTTHHVHGEKTPSKVEHVTNEVCDEKTLSEIKPIADDLSNKKTLNEESDVSNHIHSTGTSNSSLKRTGKDLEPVQKTKYQRDALLPPSPKVRKVFICRTEKAASSLLQSCFVWLDKMDEQFLNDGRLDTAEISEDVLFSLNNVSQTYTKSQHGHKHYKSKAVYLDEKPIVIIEPSEGESGVNKQNDSSCIEKTVERKETSSRIADVLRLLEEKRKAIEVLRQKQSFALSSTVS